MGREVRRIWVKGDNSHKVRIEEMEESDSVPTGDEIQKKDIRYYLYIDNNLIDNCSKSFEEAKGLAVLKLNLKDEDIWEQIA